MLLIDPEKTGRYKIPAKAWLRKKKKSLTKPPIPFTSSLTVEQRAMIANWFEEKIGEGDKMVRRHWMGFVPIAHAHTVFLANQLKTQGGAKTVGLTQSQLLDKAWEVQTFSAQQDLFLDVYIERECLVSFEELLFERSSKAGVAGNCQWGLDAGEHQSGWDPYIGLPSTWNHEDRDDSEGEIEVRLSSAFFSPADLRTDRVIDSPDLISWESNTSKNISCLLWTPPSSVEKKKKG